MMNAIQKQARRACAAALLFCAASVSAMNLLQPYNILIRPAHTPGYHFQCFALGETGFASRNYDACGAVNSPLRIWNSDQNALAMLNGFAADSIIGQKRSALDANDNGVRGHFCVDGDLDLPFAAAFAARFFFLENWSLSFYLPAYVMRLNNVVWTDLTQDQTAEDQRVKQLLTNNIFSVARECGCDLDLGCWHRGGLGDLTLFLEWERNFPQAKIFLKNVHIFWRVGITFPTGRRMDEDKIFAIPFGTDGAFALPFGMGIDLDFMRFFGAGGDVLLMHTFGNTRTRRIKTDIDQTELLLLQKIEAYRDYGLTQQFDLYFKLFACGAMLKVGYQFVKRADDHLSFNNNTFSATIANSAEYLKFWTMHQIIANFSYDFGAILPDDFCVIPRVGAFLRLPFNGKRTALKSSIGFSFAIDF